MIFLAQTHWLYAKLVKISALYRYVATFVITGTTLFGWFFFLYVPTTQKINYYRSEIATYRRKQVMCKQAQGACKQLNDGVCSLRNKLACEFTKNKKESPVNWLLQTVQKTGLQFNSVQVKCKNKHDWYCKQAIDLQVNGPLLQIVSFFKQVKKSAYLLECQQLNVAMQDENRFACNAKLDWYSMETIG